MDVKTKLFHHFIVWHAGTWGHGGKLSVATKMSKSNGGAGKIVMQVMILADSPIRQKTDDLAEGTPYWGVNPSGALYTNHCQIIDID